MQAEPLPDRLIAEAALLRARGAAESNSDRLHRASDTVARLGGDEFAVLLATGGASSAPRVVADKILKGLEAPFVVDGQQMDIAASIGISTFPEHGADGPALLRAAVVAMYDAKRS